MHDREADRFPEALQEDRRQHRQQQQRHSDRDDRTHAGTNGFSMMCAVASAADSVMVMTKSVAANPSRHEDEGLALPARQQLLEHRDAALAVRAGLGDAAVDRQRAEQRQQDEDERRDRREAPAARNAMPG